MSEVILGENRWSLIEARRHDDLAFGLVKQEERRGISAEVFAQNGWRLIYDEPKKYHRNDHVTNVRVWFNQDETLVLKLDDAGMLVDQASALTRLRQEFGVKVPDHLVLIKDGDITLLQMEKLDFQSGHQIYEMLKGNRSLPQGCTLVADDLREMYVQAKAVAKSCRAHIKMRPFDQSGLHHGNWGVTAAAFNGWRAGTTLAAGDVVVFDPVSMSYDHV